MNSKPTEYFKQKFTEIHWSIQGISLKYFHDIDRKDLENVHEELVKADSAFNSVPVNDGDDSHGPHTALNASSQLPYVNTSGSLSARSARYYIRSLTASSASYQMSYINLALGVRSTYLDRSHDTSSSVVTGRLAAASHFGIEGTLSASQAHQGRTCRLQSLFCALSAVNERISSS